MQEISLKQLLEAGCHFGHQVPRWNPRAASFIYTARDHVHIIDLAKTKVGLEKALDFVRETASQGGLLIFVGTKRQAKGIVEEEAKRAGAMFLVARWPGGLLTNWWEMKKNLDKLRKGREEKAKNLWEKFTKKEQLLKSRELLKLEQVYGGVADLNDLPQVLFLVDIRKEESALKEAEKTNVKTVAIVDTNANPDLVDFPIPANDDAVGSIKLITSLVADAYFEGRELFNKKEAALSKKTETEKPDKKKEKVPKEKKPSEEKQKKKNHKK
ncbi:MAG: 30S ribosomal protein S2 [Patescibacteria group bacterium]|nr:30S ribosomal protein S2 [Patescibacteria group bacterium]MCL5095836.1 30S ribosomal protein S2 [Patescibacteria group bacterium]